MIILEDSSGLENANSYASLSAADAYFDARNKTVWADASTKNKEAALIRATDFIDANYVFYSVPKTKNQSLKNPRLDDDVLANELVKACLELSLIALERDIFEVDNSQYLLSSTESGDGIGSISETYSELKKDSFQIITNILRPIAKKRSSNAQIGRLVK